MTKEISFQKKVSRERASIWNGNSYKGEPGLTKETAHTAISRRIHTCKGTEKICVGWMAEKS